MEAGIMMRVQILGYSGGFPAAKRPTSGYLLKTKNHNILIDCGSGVLSELTRIMDPENIDAIILTHWHQDHISDLGVFGYLMQMKKADGFDIHSIPVYCPAEPQIIRVRYENDPNFSFHTYSSDTIIDWGDLHVSFYKTIHPVECYAVRADYFGSRFVYTSDTSYDPMIIDFVRDSNLLIVDAGALESHRKEKMLHSTPTEWRDIYLKSGSKRVVLSHLIPYYDVSDTVAEAAALGIWHFELPKIGEEYIVSGGQVT